MRTTLAEPAAPLRRLPRWLIGIVGFLLLGAGLLYFGLDPWLRRQTEKWVSARTHGQYVLQIGSLRTHLLQGAVGFSDLHLRPTRRFMSDAELPDLTIDLATLNLRGLSLLAFWRRQPQHLTQLELTGLRLRINKLPQAMGRGVPLYQQLPGQIPGLRLDELTLQDARLRWAGRRRPRLAFQRLDLAARDLQLYAAGATDTTRLFYAKAWFGHLKRVQGLFDHHRGWIKALNFNSQTGFVAVDSLQIRPTQRGRRGPTYLAMDIRQVRLLDWRLSGLHRHHFQAQKLLVTGLRFDLTAPTTPPPPVHRLLAPIFRRLDLADARLEDGEVQVRGVSYLPVVHQLQLRAHDLRLDSIAFTDRRRVLYAHAWALRTGPGDLLLDAPFYRLHYASLEAATPTGLLRATALQLAPTMPITAMARRKGHEVSHITLQLPAISALGLDYGSLLRKEGLRAQRVTLRQPTVRIVGDGRFPINPQESVVTPEAVGRLPFQVALDRIDFQHCRLDFAYTSPLSNRPGTMRVTQLDGTIRHAANLPGTALMEVQVAGWLQDRCYVRANGRFDLRDPRGRHHISGTFGPTPFGILNPMLAPTGLLRFKNGEVQHIVVQMTGDRNGIRGTMRARYRGMHIQYLNADLERTLLNRITSKVVNKVVLHDNNPDQPGDSLRIGRIISRRERRFSVFALWKQGLLSGMLSSFGVGEKTAEKISEKTTEPSADAAAENGKKNGSKHRLRPIKKLLQKIVPGK